MEQFATEALSMNLAHQLGTQGRENKEVPAEIRSLATHIDLPATNPKQPTDH